MSRNTPGKPGNKGYTEAERENTRLVADVKDDYDKARGRVAWYERRVQAKGTTFVNNVGNRVVSPEQKNLEAALAHLARQTRIYKDVVGVEPEAADGELAVVLDFQEKKAAR